MPRKRSSEQLQPVMFRLSVEHVAALDELAAERTVTENSPQSRSDALRWLINDHLRRYKSRR